jgi:hypothetical protein
LQHQHKIVWDIDLESWTSETYKTHVSNIESVKQEGDGIRRVAHRRSGASRTADGHYTPAHCAVPPPTRAHSHLLGEAMGPADSLPIQRRRRPGGRSAGLLSTATAPQLVVPVMPDRACSTCGSLHGRWGGAASMGGGMGLAVDARTSWGDRWGTTACACAVGISLGSDDCPGSAWTPASSVRRRPPAPPTTRSSA